MSRLKRGGPGGRGVGPAGRGGEGERAEGGSPARRVLGPARAGGELAAGGGRGGSRGAHDRCARGVYPAAHLRRA